MLDINHTILTDAIKRHASEIATILLKEPLLGDVEIAPEEGEIEKLADELGLHVTYYAGSDNYDITEGKTKERIKGFIDSAGKVLAELNKIKRTQAVADDVHLSNEIQILAFSLGMKIWHNRDGNNYTAYPEKGPDAFMRFTLGGAEMLAKLKRMRTKNPLTDCEIDDQIMRLADGLKLEAHFDSDTNTYRAWDPEAGVFVSQKVSDTKMLQVLIEIKLALGKVPEDADVCVMDDLATQLGLHVIPKMKGTAKTWEAWGETSRHTEHNRILVGSSTDDMIEQLKNLIGEKGQP